MVSRKDEDRSTQIENHNDKSRDRNPSSVTWARRGSGVSQLSKHEVINAAKHATEREHQMGLLEAIKTYPKAVGWSVLASGALVMDGYDIQVIYSFFGFQAAFAERYGSRAADGNYQISAAWQSGLSNGSLIGQMLGLLVTGIIADRFGYRKTIAGGLIMMICFIFITFFAPNVQVLLIGEILCGIPFGVFQTITTAYAADVSFIALRPYLTSYVNLCWVMGQIIGAGVLRALVSRTDQWAYRIPFAVQWFWPVPLLVGIGLAPESPWWLVRKGRLEDADACVKRLTSAQNDSEQDSQQAVALMIHTNELEKSVTSGTSYLDCLKGTDLRRTEICCMVWMIQILCGGGLMGYSTSFYEQAGLNTSHSFDMTMAQFGLGAAGVLVAWTLMPWFGRRTLYLAGLTSLFLLLLIIGFVSITRQTDATAWTIGSMLLLYTFIYDITIGPLCYALVSEIASTRLRQKTIVLARNAYIISNIISNILIPRMLSPTAWDWRGRAGFFWAGVCLAALTWAFYRLPEPKGRTYAELDVLFERKVSAREFVSTSVDPFTVHAKTNVEHNPIVGRNK